MSYIVESLVISIIFFVSGHSTTVHCAIPIVEAIKFAVGGRGVQRDMALPKLSHGDKSYAISM